MSLQDIDIHDTLFIHVQPLKNKYNIMIILPPFFSNYVLIRLTLQLMTVTCSYTRENCLQKKTLLNRLRLWGFQTMQPITFTVVTVGKSYEPTDIWDVTPSAPQVILA